MPQLQQFIIYFNPADHPGQYVVRRALITGLRVDMDTEPRCVGRLEDCRKAIPAGCVNIGRRAADDPVILEVWT